MNKWNVVWKAYHDECSRRALIQDVFHSNTLLVKLAILVFLSVFVFAGGLVIYQIFTGEKFVIISLITFLVSEVFFLIMVLVAKNKYVNSVYTDFDTLWIPPETKKLQRLRYLKFRKRIKDMDITFRNVPNLICILESREKLEEVSGTYIKRFWGVMLTLCVALAVAGFKSLDIVLLIYASLILLAVAFFIYQIASIVPAPLERIRELNYFLTMFQKEFESKFNMKVKISDYMHRSVNV